MTENNTFISAIILTRDNQDLIKDCLISLEDIADEIIIVDDGSEDKTLEIAKVFTAKIYEIDNKDFSFRRNYGAEKAKGDWLLYIDADERIDEKLKKEIKEVVSSNKFSAYAIPRRNILLGKELKHGGWWPDYVLRLMKKESLIKWEGELHEQPRVKGEVGKLVNPLIHISHRSISEMVEKTNKWSEIEAKLLFKSNHPKMVWWRFFSVAFREVWFRGIKKLGFLDGPIGIIEIIYQMYSRMITYAKLWEMQVIQEDKKTNI
ncbi:MAG: glycosyltransferase family 2 protein [Patescibacteria group bacterium]|nr:glycosyltransferase family 2 protein [Patescibacteria group bacterium]